MKWSLNTYQTCQDWELDRILDVAKNTGYSGVEFLEDFKQLHGFEWDTPEERWPELKAKVDASGVACASLTSCQKFDSPDASARAESVERVKRVIDCAEFMDCTFVRVLGDRFDETNRNDVILWAGEALRELGTYAAPKGVKVSIEMHSSFTEPVACFHLMDLVRLPNVGLIFNCVWHDSIKGDVHAFHESLLPHLTSVHTHQAEDPATFNYYRDLFSTLARRKFEGYVSNECAYRGPDPAKVLRMYVALFNAFAGT